MSMVVFLVAAWLAVANAATLSSMSSVDYRQVPIKEKALHQPPMQEVADVLSKGLTSTFATVQVTVEDSPDLTKSPYNLTSPGLAGNPKLVEIGGLPYLLPEVQRDKVYDMATLATHLQRDPAFLVGAGSGPWPYIGVSSECIINLSINNGSVDQGTHVVTLEPEGAPKGSALYIQRRLPNTETRTAMLGNYLLSEGKPGEVGLGGTFMLLGGKVKHHVTPDFSREPLCSDSDVNDWLHYFEMKAPITHVGTLVTGDLGLDLRVQHFHGFSAHGDGGHYHYDTTPDAAHYEGYFVPAGSIVRVDPPVNTDTVWDGYPSLN